MNIRNLFTLAAWLVLMALVWPAQAVEVTVQVENLAPEGGVYLSPMWVGFDGPQFSLFTTTNAGTPSAGLTQLATTGDASLLQQEFQNSVQDGVEGLIGTGLESPNSPNFAPGTSGQRTFDLDPGTNRFMNFAAKVYPGATTFIASTSQIDLFNDEGQFNGKQIITILGTDVMEASTSGTSKTTATTKQSSLTIAGNSGSSVTAANLPGVVFDPVATNLALPGTVVARITVVPEPATIFLLAGGSLILLSRRRHAGQK